MKEIKLTRDFFLWSMSVIYLAAFSSLYHQIPGLYGDNGILPARAVITLEADPEIVQKKAKEVPSLLWLAPALGIDVPFMMDLLALLGVVISFGCMVWGRMRDMTNFTLLWMLYFSLYQVGQTFLWFQWDIMLLEAGFITILVAPLGFLQSIIRGTSSISSLPHRPHDTVSLWLVRWLLFRLMFASGVVKLTSMCPTWWGLTALNYHFESQCIPTPLAWYAHHIPEWFLKLGVVGTYVIEIAVPFLFFIPIRSLRIFSFYCQVLFQIMIILTGNYNFFNLLTIALCISLVDDEFLLNLVGRSLSNSKNTSGTGLQFTKYAIVKVIEGIVYGGLAYWTVHFFSLKFKPDWSIDSRIAFTAAQFQKALNDVLPVTIFIGLVSLTANILLAFYRTFSQTGLFQKVFSLMGTIFVSAVAIWLFIVSLVPHASLDPRTQRNLWPVVQEWYSNIQYYHVANPYGLFRRMTGVDGRPELVIEGSNSMDAGWKEYHFLYKPGDLSDAPTFLIPHQPRLDWQMWFAALGSYEHNPWFVSFVYRLLEGRKDVLDLMDKERLPFPVNKPPKFIRAILYKYSYTPLSSKDKPSSDWWTRRKVREYFNSGELEGKQMVEFLKAAGIPLEKTRYIRVTNAFLKKLLLRSRSYIQELPATMFVWSLLGTGLFLNFISPILRLC